nr:unnamed protein product [Spirometra erinaceieuropaei]
MLNKIAKDWVVDLGLKRGIFCTDSIPCEPSSVLVQGSTSLGASFKNSDIDAVLVTPNFIHREDFFGSFVNVLKQHQSIKEILPIPYAFVPLIKMKVEETCVDLILSRLNLPYVPCPLMFSEKPEIFYSNVDQYSVHGLSGLHLAQKFHDLVPDFSLFTDLLKVVKTWASRRLIKDYVYGFPASVAWAVLCAYICIHTGFQTSLSNSYLGLLDQTILLAELIDLQSGVPSRSVDSENFIRPPKRKADATLTSLVQIFFTYFSHWLWPCPVILSPVVSVPELRLYSWQSRNAPLKNHEFMPIITPVFPHKNAAYTVRPSTRDIVVKELRRAHNLVKKIIRGETKWAELFEVYDLRQDHRHFLKLELAADDYQELVRLGGLIDSRLRDLASFLEENDHIRSVRICKVKDRQTVGSPTHWSPGTAPSSASPSTTAGSFCRAWLLGMDIIPAPNSVDGTRPKREVDITAYLANFYNILHERDAQTNFLEKLLVSYLTWAEVQSLRL